MVRLKQMTIGAIGALLATSCGGGGDTSNADAEPVAGNPQSANQTEDTTPATGIGPDETETTEPAQISDPTGETDELVETEPPASGDDPNSPGETIPDEAGEATEPLPVSADPAASAGPDRVMIVMDGSGSMWGQIDGRAKMEIAREALVPLVDGLPADSPTGLMAYGHRRQGDCDDIEILRTPETGAGADIIGAAETLVPRGKTPLSAAVQQAAETLSYEDSPATVILITDGIETCDVDPCALGETLEARGVSFTAHIVGFGLSEQEGRQVACLAEETGGQYIQAADAGELSSAMVQVAEAIEAPPEDVVEVPTAEIMAPETVEIGHDFEVTWNGPETPAQYDYIDLVEPDYTRTSRSLSQEYASNGQPATLRAPAEPGAYKVRYVWLGAGNRTVIAEQTLEVVDAEAAIFAPEAVGIGKPFEFTWRGPDNQNDYVDLVPPDQTATNTQITYAYTRNGETLEMTAPGTPGEYKLRYVTVGSGGERVLTSVPITVEDIRAEVAFNPSVELGSVLEVSWTGPDTRNDYIDIVERGFQRTNTQLSYAYTRNGNPAELRLPTEPGEYDVRYILSATSDGERVLAVAPLELTETTATLEFPAEVTVGDMLVVDWTGPNAHLDYIDIVEPGFTATNTQLSYTYTREGSPMELSLPGEPGNYDVRYILKGSDGERVLVTEPLTIVDAEVSLSHPETIALGQTLEVEWTGPEGRLNYVDIVERGFRRTNEQLSYAYAREDILEIRLPASPGEYDVRFVLNASDGERVLARNPITVTDVESSLMGPETAEAGALLEINWEGPGSYQDFIDVVPRGKQLPKDSITYAYTRTSNPVELRMPDEPGEYDMRYIHVGSDERVVKARREITVE